MVVQQGKETNPMINFTPEKLKKLKKAYMKAAQDKVDTFMFEGHELVVGYAKYLIEYLEMQFGEFKHTL